MPVKENKNAPANRLIPGQPQQTVAGDYLHGLQKWALPAILLYTALLYSNTLRNQLTTFDDDYYIQKNPFLKDISRDGIKAIFTSFYAGNYHPLTTLTYLFEYTKYGLDPFPYHLLNLLLHLANTFLVFKLTELLSGKRITALVVCILFAVHPMHVESVAWVSETKDVQYAAFYLSALIAYLRYIAGNSGAKYYVICLLLFLASLFSKSAAVTLPVLLIVIDIYKGRTLTAKTLAEKIPFLSLSVLFGVLNLLSQSAQGAITDLNGAYSIINRIFLFTTSLSVYLTKLILPFGLSAMHFFPGTAHGILPWYYYLSLPFLAFVTWLATRKSVYRKEIVFGFFFFLVAISVMLQVIAVGSALTAERYTYIPYIGLFYFIGQWLSDQQINKYRQIIWGIFVLSIVVFSVQTWDRVNVWNNDESLFGDIRKKDPAHATLISQGFEMRGYTKQNKNDLPGALEDYTQAILFNPQFDDAYLKRAVIHYALGDLNAAVADYSSVIRLKPNDTDVYNYRGWAYFQSGNVASALEDFNKAISLNPNFAEAYNNRGWLYYRTGKKEAAMEDYNKAIACNPQLSGAYNNRGWAYYESGNAQLALADYDKATSADPNNNLAYSNLAAIKANTGDLKGAANAYDSVLKINPNDNVACYELAFVRLHLSDTPGACDAWKKAASLGNANAAKFLNQYCH